MDQIAKTILLFFSFILGVENFPQQTNHWQILQDWKKTKEGYFTFSAQNKQIANQCQQNPSHYIKFPAVIHSSIKVTFNNVILAISSSSDFKHTKSFYGIITIPCHQLSHQKGILKWDVISYSQYFARFHYFPKISNTYPIDNFLNETLHIIAAGILLMLCAIYFIVFRGKISSNKLQALFLSNFFSSIYFIGTSTSFFGLNIEMLVTHKIADTGLWLGLLFFFYFLYLEKLLLKWMNILYISSAIIGITIITIGTTGDIIQLGTSIPFPFTIAFTCYSMCKSFYNSFYKQKNYWQFIALSCALITYCNDILLVIGIIDFFPLSPIGIAGSYFFTLLSIDEKINKTYTERDKLKILTNQLKEANKKLKITQDELIKSEKIAALGQAVGRVAHELNTPIYGIRNSSQLMQKLTEKILITINDSSKDTIKDHLTKYKQDLEKMLKVVLVSTSRAAELVANFKKITVDQINPQKKAFKLLSYIKESVFSMQHTLNRKKITVNYAGDDPTIFHDPSLFHQVTQNLISNTDKYAYENGGTIDISVKEHEDEIEIQFKDYGAGIPQKNLLKIFDPFFTTGGGKGGTGLGLNIVYQIITSQIGGKVICKSQLQKGSTFIITFPKHLIME